MPAIGAALFRKVLPFLFLLVISSCQSKQKNMATQTSVKGILQDSAGRPVPNAVVMIVDGSHEFNDMAAVTNDSGEFALPNVMVPGRYVLQIQGESVTQTMEVNLLDSSALRIRL
jgi:hypothetical protein